ncbi:unnamed protein product [Durusdinium trenchii]|uniref:Uncharacterized protein n=1 Tax=Durusdinium trenchii TaxID=1381693 RepID=A0ABP0QVR5_9DINO
MESTNSHAEWEKKLSSLDLQEREVHQKQLRLIRDHTSALARDLAALKTELSNHKVTLETLQSTNSFDKSLMEMNQKKHQQYVDQQLLEMSQLTKLVTTDEKLHSVKEQMEHSWRETLQKAQHSMEEKFSRRLDRLEQQLSDLSGSSQDQHSELRRHVEGMKVDHQESHKSLADRLGHLQGLHQQLHENHGALQKNLRELHNSHADATKRHEDLHVAQQVAKESHQALEERVQKLHNSNADTMKRHEDLHGAQQAAKESHQALEERLQKLHASHSDTASSHEELGRTLAQHHAAFTSDLTKLQENMNELREHHGQTRAQGRRWEAHQASIEERLDSVEGTITELFEKNAREMEAIQSRMSDMDLQHQAILQDKEPFRLVAERTEYLERLLGAPFRKKRGEEDLVEDCKRVSYSVYDQLSDQDERLTGLECRMHDEHSRLWSAMDSHTHDLSSQTLRKATGSPDASPASQRSQRVQSLPAMQTVPVVSLPGPMPRGPTAVPLAAAAPPPAAPVLAKPMAVPAGPARFENWSPTRSGQGPVPGGFAKASSRTATTSLASVATVTTVASAASSSRTLPPAGYPWPEEVERISCGRTRYMGTPTSAEVVRSPSQ